MSEIAGKWALVTGASSGLGVDFARELAERGCSVILTARRKDRLEDLAGELRETHGVEVEVISVDLGLRSGPESLFQAIAERNLEVSILVNNAGFGVFGDYLEIPLERETAMLDLDIVALVRLTRLFAGPMVERGWGRILQVASVAAFQATPGYAAYAAAKAFVLLFGEAVHHELKGTGVTCTVVSPGVTATEFLDVAGQKPTWYQRRVMMESAEVARIGIRAMLKGRSSVVAGRLNAIAAWSIRLTPRRVATAVAARLMR